MQITTASCTLFFCWPTTNLLLTTWIFLNPKNAIDIYIYIYIPLKDFVNISSKTCPVFFVSNVVVDSHLSITSMWNAANLRLWFRHVATQRRSRSVIRRGIIKKIISLNIIMKIAAKTARLRVCPLLHPCTVPVHNCLFNFWGLLRTPILN